jgi:hypothetical protein
LDPADLPEHLTIGSQNVQSLQLPDVSQLEKSAVTQPESTRTTDVLTELINSPTKIKRGIPRWFDGKVSPAFREHIFWPSPPKQKSRGRPTELFPACASSSAWRALYREKEQRKTAPKKKTTPVSELSCY